MQDAMKAELIRPVPSIIPGDIPALSDDECLARLARAVEKPDSAQLDEVARLIAFAASPSNITGAELLIDGGVIKSA